MSTFAIPVAIARPNTGRTILLDTPFPSAPRQRPRYAAAAEVDGRRRLPPQYRELYALAVSLIVAATLRRLIEILLRPAHIIRQLKAAESTLIRFLAPIFFDALSRFRFTRDRADA